MDAIRKLWEGKGLGDARTISKVAAVLLVLFSGIWPHLKLLLLHLGWFWPFVHGLWLGRGDGDNARARCCRRRKRASQRSGHRHYRSHSHRSPFLRALSALGKWSLADVLVVCILIAVLHLDRSRRPGQDPLGHRGQAPRTAELRPRQVPRSRRRLRSAPWAHLRPPRKGARHAEVRRVPGLHPERLHPPRVDVGPGAGHPRRRRA